VDENYQVLRMRPERPEERFPGTHEAAAAGASG